MGQERLGRMTVLLGIGALFIGAILWLFTSEVVQMNLSFIKPENMYICLVEAELFFILIIWPFFITPTLDENYPVPKNKFMHGKVSILLLQILLFFILVLPYSLICQNISNVDWVILLKGYVNLLAIALLVTAIFWSAFTRKLYIEPWYYFAVIFLSIGLPFLYYIDLEFYDENLLALSVFSPFWGALYIDKNIFLGETWLVQSIIFGTSALIIYTLSYLFVKRHSRQII